MSGIPAGYVSKLEQVRRALDAGNDIEALRIAARFPRLDEDVRVEIQRGWSAHRHPKFYEAMGKNPAALVADGIIAVRAKYARREAPDA